MRKPTLCNGLIDIPGNWLYAPAHLQIMLMVEELKRCSMPNECSMCLLLARASCSLGTRKQPQFLNYLSVPLCSPQKRVGLYIYLFHGPICRVIALGFCDCFFSMDFLFLIPQQGGKRERKYHINVIWIIIATDSLPWINREAYLSNMDKMSVELLTEGERFE